MVKRHIVMLLIMFILAGCSRNSNDFNNEFIYYHNNFSFRSAESSIDETIINEIKKDSHIINLVPYYYFYTEYNKDSSSTMVERNISVYVDGQLTKSVSNEDNNWISVFVDGYYNRDMIEACVTKTFEYNENMISGFLSKRAASALGVSDGEDIIIEVDCAIPISNTANIDQSNLDDCVYVTLSNRLYKKVTLKIAIEGIISTDVDGIPAILIPEKTIENLIEQYQVEEVKPYTYLIETSLNKKELLEILDEIDSMTNVDKRHWFNENLFYD